MIKHIKNKDILRNDVELGEGSQPPTTDGKDIVVSFSSQEISSHSEQFSHTFILKFASGCPKIARVQEVVSSWGLTSAYCVAPMDPKHSVLYLSSEIDHKNVWTRGTYRIDSHLMRILKWSPDFNPKENWLLLPFG